MKKFKYPLAIEGTEDELHALIPELIRLGYRAWNSESWLNDWGNGCVLVTDFALDTGEIGFSATARHNPKREIVQASNPELVLALAAMVDDNKAYVGEWIIGGGYDIIPHGLHKITTIDGLGSFSVDGRDANVATQQSSLNYNRKATKKEIINHFKQSTMEKKIKGYMLIKDLPFVRAGVLYTQEKQRKDFYNFNGGMPSNALYVDTIKNTNWFAPIYEEVEQKKIITLTCKGGTFEIEVSKKGIYYLAEGTRLDINVLIDAIIGRNMVDQEKEYRYFFKPSHIDSGCKKEVPVGDWEKVLKAYDEINGSRCVSQRFE